MGKVILFNGGVLLVPDDVERDENGKEIKVFRQYVNLPGAPDYDPQRARQNDIDNFEKSVALTKEEMDKYIYDKK